MYATSLTRDVVDGEGPHVIHEVAVSFSEAVGDQVPVFIRRRHRHNCVTLEFVLQNETTRL